MKIHDRVKRKKDGALGAIVGFENPKSVHHKPVIINWDDDTPFNRLKENQHAKYDEIEKQ